MSDESLDKQQEIDTIVGLIVNRYGLQLTDSEMEEIRSNTDFVVETHWKFRGLKLANGIEPMSVFIPSSSRGSNDEQ